MSSLARQQANREKGESRTLAILSDRFWILKRVIDVEGADFLIQIPAASHEELKERKFRIEVFGLVQSKYFENSNQVRIAKKYVEDPDGKAWTEFFAMLHTTNEGGEDSCYFFTARDIQKNFYFSQDGEYYCFSITKDRDYSAYCNIKKSDMLDTISTEMARAEQGRNADFVKIIYVAAPSVFQAEGKTHTIRRKGPIAQETIYHHASDTTQVGTYLDIDVDSDIKR